jgi:hypothetical protein
MSNPFDDPEVIKIATLKRTSTHETLSRAINEEQVRKKAELTSRGLSRSGASIKIMLDLNMKRLEGIVYGHYNAWKEALSETGYGLTSVHLRRIADESAKYLENAPNQVVESLKRQPHGMADTVDKMRPGIEQEIHSIKAKFKRETEIEIARAKVAERDTIISAKTPMPMPDFSFIEDPEIRRIVERDYSELKRLDPNASTKSVLIMSGTIIEGLLLDATVKTNTLTTEKAADMTLQQLLTAATRQSIIREDRLGNAVRNYRNLIHPARELRDQLHFTHADATLATAAVDVIIQDIKKYFDNQKPSG